VINQNGEPLIFGKTDFIIGFADPMFSIQCTNFVEQKMGDFTKKDTFYNGKV